ncbi:MAG: hypothetical protein DRN40_05000 [Thermoplasmata archaeon]|nr:MAG: hypothetical protein DRN40_05000 [Thermoplasmata archaeon]
MEELKGKMIEGLVAYLEGVEECFSDGPRRIEIPGVGKLTLYGGMSAEDLRSAVEELMDSLFTAAGEGNC